MNQTFFHIAFVIIFIAFFGIRAVYQAKANRERGNVEYKEGTGHRALRLIFGLPFMLAFFGYMFYPPLLAWAEVDLPEWLQWVGMALGVSSLPFIWWIQWALGLNFDTTLHVRDQHTLITYGPYRWMRHPMYTALYIHLLAVTLLTQNWLIGLVFLGSLTLIIVTRVNHEEQTMIEKFGEQYVAYMKRTGRFFPKFA
jgi:protein-S-isoprenylcysteine O-methyltransferase Ste14